MRWIKTYKKYQESIIVDLSFGNVSDVLESLTIWHDALLNSIRAEEKDIFSTLKLSDDFRDRLNFDDIHDSVEFINSLSSIALKKSQVENSEDYQTFLNKPCKFMFLYDINSNELENPQYLMFQTWNDTISKWESLKLYKINDDVKKFYDKGVIPPSTIFASTRYLLVLARIRGLKIYVRRLPSCAVNSARRM